MRQYLFMTIVGKRLSSIVKKERGVDMKATIAAKRRREGYTFILPGFLYMVVILGYPLVYNIILSFKNVNVKNFASGESVFVGFQNYIDLFHDETFLLILKNTFVFTICCLIFQFTIGFIFALFFSKKFTIFLI